MSILDLLRSKKRLINKAERHRDQHQAVLDMISSAKSLEELQDHVAQSVEAFERDAKILEGSDIGRGVIKISHWSARLLAMNLCDILNENPEAINFIELKFYPVEYRRRGDTKATEPIIVTVQRVNGKSPADVAKELREEIAGLREQNEVLLAQLHEPDK